MGTPVRAEASAAERAHDSPPTPVSSAKPRSSTRSSEDTGTPPRLDLDGLRVIAQAAYEAWRARHPDDDKPGKGFGDRFLQLDTTMDGAGRLTGDLTGECSAAVTAVLEALGKKRGPEDDRTAAQRFHDALQEGCGLLSLNPPVSQAQGQPRTSPAPATTPASPAVPSQARRAA
jgi:hypothetical protein